MKTDLPEVAAPIVPKRWSDLTTMTVAFGHGLAVTPLQAAVADAALVNGGKLIPPTFLPRTRAEADKLAVQVVKPETSDQLRYLFSLNVEKGSGRSAAVPGYIVGGKTGTAEKVDQRPLFQQQAAQFLPRRLPDGRPAICRSRRA